MQSLPAKKRLAGLSPEELLAELSPEKRLAGLPPDDGLPQEAEEEYP